MDSSLSLPYGSRVAAWLRLAGFFSLIAAFMPVHIFFGLVKPSEPYRVTQLFHRTLLRILGFQVRVHGAPSQERPVLFVSNHTSYLDIPVLAALIPASFVAKAELANWPLFGFLARMQRTVFIERRAVRAGEQRDQLAAHLAKNWNLILFPEGTSTDGTGVLPFKSALFSIMQSDQPFTIQPVSILCTGLDGLPITRALRPLYAWYGDMTLVGHLWNVFKMGHFTIDVVFHPPVPRAAFAGRKELAAYCQQQVARGIEQCLAGREISTVEVPKLPAPA